MFFSLLQFVSCVENTKWFEIKLCCQNSNHIYPLVCVHRNLDDIEKDPCCSRGFGVSKVVLAEFKIVFLIVWRSNSKSPYCVIHKINTGIDSQINFLRKNLICAIWSIPSFRKISTICFWNQYRPPQLSWTKPRKAMVKPPKLYLLNSKPIYTNIYFHTNLYIAKPLKIISGLVTGSNYVVKIFVVGVSTSKPNILKNHQKQNLNLFHHLWFL